MSREYHRWASNQDITLFLDLRSISGVGVPGASPEVSIRRYKETITGTLLDNYFWNGTGFQATAFWHTMTEVDPVNNQGQYIYNFQQSLVALQHTYQMYYRHEVTPVGFDSEQHIITNEVFIPDTQPDPIIFGENTVLGQLQLIKDNATGLFDGATDALHFQRTDVARILGLLHQNAIIDNQVYTTAGQLESARLRVFDSSANVPSTPGGSEVTGLLHQYTITAVYKSGSPTEVESYVLKTVL